MCRDSKRYWVLPASLLKLQRKCLIFRFFEKSSHLRPKRWFSEASSDLETQGSRCKILILMTLTRKGPGGPGGPPTSHVPSAFFNQHLSAKKLLSSVHGQNQTVARQVCWRPLLPSAVWCLLEEKRPRTPQSDGLTPCKKLYTPWPSL